jgi:hypothetical protein
MYLFGNSLGCCDDFFTFKVDIWANFEAVLYRGCVNLIDTIRVMSAFAVAKPSDIVSKEGVATGRQQTFILHAQISDPLDLVVGLFEGICIDGVRVSRS